MQARVTQEKKALRLSLRTLRTSLSVDERDSAAQRICARLFRSGLLSDGMSLMLYAAIGSEVETMHIFAEARARGHRVAFPRVITGEERMEAAWVESPAQLAPGTMEIPEPLPTIPPVDPCSIDVILVPGLGFDRHGHRLGYGAGFYDRYLATAAHATRIGLTYDTCIIDSLPVESHDVTMHWVLTESVLMEAHRDN